MKLSSGFIVLTLVMLTTASQPDIKVDKDDTLEDTSLDILQNTDQDFPEKDHSKRTFGSTTYDTFGLAKHVKVKGGQKVVLGYTPVDLKYVPVIKPWRNGWRFKQRPAIRPRPLAYLPPRQKPDTNGWKPILHVPPPQKTYGWSKPGVTVLKPIRPSAPDHFHHDAHHESHNYHHQDEHHDSHHDIHHDIVHSNPQVIVPTVVSTVVPTVPVQTPVTAPSPVSSVPVYINDGHHYAHAHAHAHSHAFIQGPDIHHHGHFDYIQPHPQVVYYNPLSHVARPDLPVLPLGASFPVPVGTVSSQTHLQVPTPTVIPAPPVVPAPAVVSASPVVQSPAFVPDYYNHHYHQQLIPAGQPVIHSHVDAVHEVPAPHFHPAHIPVSPVIPAQVASLPAPVPHYYDYHEHSVDIPQPVTPVTQLPHVTPVAHLTPQVTRVAQPHTPQSAHQTVEYHGHISHLIQAPHHQHQIQPIQTTQNAHQYIPENYNPHILPGSTGTLSSGFLNPGFTDLQIPEHLPEHPHIPNYNHHAGAVAPTEESYYHGHVGLLPEGIVQPQIELEPPINK